MLDKFCQQQKYFLNLMFESNTMLKEYYFMYFLAVPVLPLLHWWWLQCQL